METHNMIKRIHYDIHTYIVFNILHEKTHTKI